MKATLVRLLEKGDATFGHFVPEGGETLVLVLEHLWVDADHDGLSDHDVSRIPAGVYRCIRRFSPKHGYDVFELQGVPGRGNIEIHPGNTTKDTLGCILVGNTFGTLDGKPAVLDSKAAFAKFMAHFAGVNEFELTVRDIGR